jgi:hypothetical protein
MQRKSRWTRFAHTDAAASFGFADCVAALKENLWGDAAKLLYLHGDESAQSITNTVVAPPIRYQLDFFECPICAYQSARITTEDKDGEGWIARPEYVEAFKAGAHVSRGTVTQRTISASRVIASAASAAIKLWAPNRTTFLYLVAIALLFLFGWVFTIFIRKFGF